MGGKKCVHIVWHDDDSKFVVDHSALEVRGLQLLDLGTFGKYIHPTVLWNVELSLRRPGSSFGIGKEAGIRCHPVIDLGRDDHAWKSIHAKFKVRVSQEVGEKMIKSSCAFSKQLLNLSFYLKEFSSLPQSASSVHFQPRRTISKFEINPLIKKLHIVVSVSWRSNALQVTDTLDQIIHDRSKLIKNLKALLLSQKHSDVVFVVDSEEIPAHRSILAAMSQVFSCMFQHDTEDKRKGIIKVEDSSSEGFKSMLRSIYTGKEPNWANDNNDLLELCYLAHKYELETLQNQCARRMVSVLKTDNVCQILKAANMFNLSPVMDCIIDFLKNNKEVLKSDEWEKLQEESPSVVMTALHKLV